MIARRTTMRAIVNREVRIKGEYQQDQFSLTVQDFQIYNLNRQEYQPNFNVKEGDSVIITPSVMVTVIGERVLLAKPAPILYANGLVSCQPVIERGDGEIPPQIMFECHRDVDLGGLPYIYKMFVVE